MVIPWYFLSESGYLGNPKATAETLTSDGWLKTGDVAVVDADGHFTVVDRRKELIKYNGFQGNVFFFCSDRT